jgi:hypothetical protein
LNWSALRPTPFRWLEQERLEQDELLHFIQGELVDKIDLAWHDGNLNTAVRRMAAPSSFMPKDCHDPYRSRPVVPFA